MSKYFDGFRFFWKGMKSAKRDLLVSIEVLLVLTLVLSMILFIVEHAAQPGVYHSLWDAMLWSIMGYLENPGEFAPSNPITFAGRIIWVAIAVLKILIFAIPAGLVANGFSEAMKNDKREKQLAEYRKRLHKKFRRITNKTLREYLNSLPDRGGSKFKIITVVPQRKPLSTLQMQMGVGLQDLFDVAAQYPEFRIHNLATASSSESDMNDRFVMEHFPLNTSYGCCINRKSNITIISPSSYDENGTGWWAYYLAKFGGFNYISKDLEVDSDEPDSFYDMSEEALYDKKKKSEYARKDVAYAIIEQKEQRRTDFISDIHNLVDGKQNTWVFMVNASIKNSDNTIDLHIATNNTKGEKTTIADAEGYIKLYDALSDLYHEMNMECVNTSRYPLLKNNLLYRLQDKENIVCNGVALRPSTDVINFDNRSLLIAWRMAQAISTTLSTGGGMHEDELDELQPGFGYVIR